MSIFLKIQRYIWTAVLCVLLAAGSLAVAPEPLAAEPRPEEHLFTILHTNDEHSALIPHSPASDFDPHLENPAIGGFARLATAVGELREKKEAAGEPVVLFSGGDFIGGTPYAWLVPQGLAAELQLMQHIGYDAVTLGNHEYDYGAEALAAYLSAAGYPQAHQKTAVLATNTTAPDDHPMAQGLYLDTHTLELDNGLTLGLMGLIGEQAEEVTFSFEPLVFEDRHSTAQRAVDTLQAQGAEVIVALTHSGVAEDRALAEAVPQIDIIVGGHCHSTLYQPETVGDTIIVQAGASLAYLGVLELAYAPLTGQISIRNTQNGQPFLQKLDHRVPLDAKTDALVAEFTQALNALVADRTGGLFENILATVAVSEFSLTHQPPLQESPMGNFIADAMRMVTWEKTGQRVDFALQANGSIRGSLIPGSMEHAQNEISFYDLTLPVSLGIGEDGHAGYSICSVYLTGEEIYRLLEVAVLLKEMMGDTFFLQFSGLRYDYNPGNALLFTIPFIDQPLPTALLPGNLGSVVRAQRYTGDRIQNSGQDYVPLERGDETLYHLATDNYILSFLPMVGDMLPMLEIVPKDMHGNPVPLERHDELIVEVDGEELKVWQAVAEYAASQPLNEQGMPQIHERYSSTAGRINRVWTFPIIAWPILAVLALIAVVVLLIRRRKRRRAANR